MAKALNAAGLLQAYCCFGATDDVEAIKAWAKTELGIEIDFPVHVYSIGPLNSFVSRVRAYFRLGKFARRFRERDTVAYLREPFFFLIAYPMYAQLIFEVHQWSLYSNKILDNLLRKLIAGAIRSGKTLRLVAISEELRKRWLSLGVSADKAVALHDCIDETFFAEKPDRGFLRDKLDLPQGPLVLYAGSLYANRSVDWFLRVACDVPEASVTPFASPGIST